MHQGKSARVRMPVPISGESRVFNPAVCLSWSEWEKRRPATFPFAGTGSASAVFCPLDTRDTIQRLPDQ
jgi:hypothetical protein